MYSIKRLHWKCLDELTASLVMFLIKSPLIKHYKVKLWFGHHSLKCRGLLHKQRIICSLRRFSPMGRGELLFDRYTRRIHAVWVIFLRYVEMQRDLLPTTSGGSAVGIMVESVNVNQLLPFGCRTQQSLSWFPFQSMGDASLNPHWLPVCRITLFTV